MKKTKTLSQTKYPVYVAIYIYEDTRLYFFVCILVIHLSMFIIAVYANKRELLFYDLTSPIIFLNITNNHISKQCVEPFSHLPSPLYIKSSTILCTWWIPSGMGVDRPRN